ncbi:hypothetical protein IEQ34_020522 [Dendrobium chrysotoxum]|uniref:Uncharacterized protein n=1 Tax=Dendrobium chrysotoxum TaxID=161865 RepID=A0AAV7G158_DENCH|nr:hypothetical protein IEQ34_020522 [Dendrobium chrysotoxum]
MIWMSFYEKKKFSLKNDKKCTIEKEKSKKEAISFSKMGTIKLKPKNSIIYIVAKKERYKLVDRRERDEKRINGELKINTMIESIEVKIEKYSCCVSCTTKKKTLPLKILRC